MLPQSREGMLRQKQGRGSSMMLGCCLKTRFFSMGKGQESASPDPVWALEDMRVHVVRSEQVWQAQVAGEHSTF